MVKGIALAALIFACWFAGAFELMILVGIAHGSWWAFIPTMSYPVAFAIMSMPVAGAMLSGIVKGIVKEL